MKKTLSTICLTAGILLSTATMAFATQGATVSGVSGNMKYHGAVDGVVNSNGCDAETKCWRDSGTAQTYAYVEVVNGSGYRIGNGEQNIGNNYACSGTICHGDGRNAYGSIGTPGGTLRVFCHLL